MPSIPDFLRFFALSTSFALTGCALSAHEVHAPGSPQHGIVASEGDVSVPVQSAQQIPEDNEDRARQAPGTQSPTRSGSSTQALSSELLFKFLLGEIAGQRGSLQVAAQSYLDLAKATRDPRIARRATEIAIYGRLTPIAVEAAGIWFETEKSPAARQTLAALFIGNNDLQSAKPLLQETLSSDPENIPQSLMQLYPLLGKHADARAVLALVKDLTKTYRKYPEAHFVVSQAAFDAGDNVAALAEIDEALRMRPDWEAAALQKAQMLARESRARSLAYMQGFLAAHPKAQEVRLNYARQLINDKKFPEARAEFQRLLEDNPQNGDMAMTVALLSLQINDLDAAEAQLKRLLNMDYRDADAVRFHLGQVAEERKRFDEAAQWYLSVEGGEQYVLAHARYAFMLARQNRLAEARTHLQTLELQNEAQRVQLVQSEAQLLREARAYEDSYEILKAALAKQPDQPELLYDLALAAEKVDKLDEVETSLRRLIELKPDNAQAYNALGYTLADRTNRLTEARDYIEKALKLAPEDPFILDSMGWVEYRLGNLASGQTYLEHAFRQRPDPEIAAHLGEVLWARGKKSEAEKVWRDSQRDNPDNDELKKVIKRFIP
jgi:tetratricopeptide (TPR) repeat protein